MNRSSLRSIIEGRHCENCKERFISPEPFIGSVVKYGKLEEESLNRKGESI